MTLLRLARSVIRAFVHRLDALWHRSRKESELKDEIAFHLEEETAQRIASGSTPEHARRQARKDFGNVTKIQESTRAVWGFRWLDTLRRDVIVAPVRNVLRSPRLSLAAIVCIALAMAATSAAVTLVTATLLRPLPFPNAERLVRIWLEEAGNEPRIALSYPELSEIEGRLSTLDAFVATARSRIQFRATEATYGSRRVEGEAVTEGYFELLDVQPLMGRLFTEDEYTGRGGPVMLLSYPTWAAYYGLASDILGREVVTDNGTFEVIGVMPESFSGTVEADSGDIEFWIPITQYLSARNQERRDLRIVWSIGRLGRGVSIDTTRAELDTFTDELAGLFPESYQSRRFRVEPLGENWRSSVRQGTLVLLAAALLVLVVAGANVALLMLARAIEQRRQWAVRLALGAARLDVLRLAASETVLLVAVGSVLGLWIGPLVLRAFMTHPSLADASIVSLPEFVRFNTDPTVATICAAFFLLVALVASLGPARHSMNAEANQLMQDTSRANVGRSGRRWFRVMVLTEVALATVLAIGTSLLIRSYSGLVNQELGFQTDGILRIGLFVNESDVENEEELPTFHQRVRQTVMEQPGVTNMGVVWPTVPINWPLRTPFAAEGLGPSWTGRDRMVDVFGFDADTFDTLGMRVTSGRGISNTDTSQGAPVGVINQAFAEELRRSLGSNALESVLGIEARVGERPFRIVGIVENVRFGGPREAAGSRHQVFLPFAQAPRRMMSLLIATEGDSNSLLTPIQRRLAEIAPASAHDWIGPMDELVQDLYLPDVNFVLSILAAFTIIGLFLSATGLFAVLADSVARRRAEIGLRQALGASPSQVLTIVVTEAATLVFSGIALGAVLAWAGRQALASMLYGVSAGDPWAHLVALAAIISIATLAALIPSLRAISVAPSDALRNS